MPCMNFIGKFMKIFDNVYLTLYKNNLRNYKKTQGIKLSFRTEGRRGAPCP